MPSYRLIDLFDISFLIKELDLLHVLLGTAIQLVDDKEEVLASFGWQTICRRLHQAKPEAATCHPDICNKKPHPPKQLSPFSDCPFGLEKHIIPLRFNKQKLGAIYIGEFFIRPPDEDSFLQQAPKLRKREKEFLEILREVPIIATDRIKTTTDFLESQIESFISRRAERLERQESIEALQKKEREYLYLFNNAQVGIFRSRLTDGKVLLFNKWLAAFLGYEEHEIKEKIMAGTTTYEHFAYPMEREQVIGSFIDDQVNEMEVPLLKKDGSRIWSSFTGCINRELGCIDGVIMDITARKEVEEAVREGEAYHSSLFDNSYAIMLLSAADTGDIVDANPAALNFYGYTHEQLTGMNLADICGLSRASLIKQLAEIKASHIYSFQHQLAGGEWRDVEVIRAPVKIKGKKMVYSIINDITERRRWENSLQESERRLADIIDFLPDTTLVIDHNGSVIAWNKAAENLTGIPASAMLGRGDYEYALPFYGQRRPALIDLVLSPQLVDKAPYTVIHWEGNSLVGEDFCPQIGASGAYMWAKATPLFDNQGRIIGAIETVQDITERRMAELNQEKELRKFRILFDLAVAMTAENSLDENLNLVVEKGRELLDLDASLIALRDEVHKEVYMHTVSGISNDTIRNLRLPFGVGLGGCVADSNKGMCTEDFSGKPVISEEIDQAIQDAGLISGMAVPIQMGKRKLGVLYGYRSINAQFTPLDVETLGLLGNLAAVEISRRQTEDELRESRQQLENIVSFLPDATFALDRKGNLTTWNKAAEELTGIRAGEIMWMGQYAPGLALYGQRRPTLADLVMEPDKDMGDYYDKLHWDGTSLLAENFCPDVGKDGAPLWGKASCLYDSQGQVIGSIESVRDISEHIRAEKAMRESEQRLADIINFLPDPTLVIDREGKVLAWNRAIEEMTGVSAEQMLGQGNYEHTIPFYGARQPMLIDLVLNRNLEAEEGYLFIQRDREALVAETPLPFVKGRRMFLWAKATPLYDSRGELVGAIESIRDITQRKEAEQALQASYHQLETILAGVVSALGATAEKRDPYTAGHQRRVASLAAAIAREMNLPENQIHDIQIASALHDIGKMYIPAEILSKPGELTSIEMLLIKTHPQAGYDIIKSIPFNHPIAEILIQHHERLDGSGYPAGLTGSEILLEARIVAVADVVEAMSSHRPYRPAFSLDISLGEIIEKKGTAYDPDVVEACVRVFLERGFNFEDRLAQ